MAVYTDFFLASADELQKACPLRVPTCSLQPPWRPARPFSNEAKAAEFPTNEECEAIKRFVYYERKGLLPHILEELHLLLGGQEDQFTAEFGKPPLMVPGDNPFGGICQLPSEFVHLLAGIPQNRMASIAEEWLDTKQAKSTVAFLQKMAKAAVDQNQNMYLVIIV